MILELAMLGLFIPTEAYVDKKYALLHEQADKNGWKVVRCTVLKARNLFLETSVYKVTVGEQDFLISIDDGNTHLFTLLRAGFIETAQTLLSEAKIK